MVVGVVMKSTEVNPPTLWRASPRDRVGICVSEEGVVDDMDQNLHVGGGHLVRIGLEV